MDDIKKQYFRIFDANLNRAREGLRVIEDTARFVVGNKNGYKKIRLLRHHIDKITRAIYPNLLRERNSLEDVGRKTKELKRKNLNSILSANFRRAQESLRVLEEYSKLISSKSSSSFKEIRFKLYSLEKDFLAQD